MRVQNIHNSNGRAVPNQFIMRGEGKEIFQSYSSVIVVKDSEGVHLSGHWDYSRTTMKYLNQFLDHDAQETRARIKRGEYKLDINTQGEKI